MLNLNVGFRGAESAVYLCVSLVCDVLCPKPGRLSDQLVNFLVLARISAEEEMTLSDIFAVGSCINLALSKLTQVMLRELTLVASLVVNLGSAQVVVRFPHPQNSVFLSSDLALVSFG